MIIDYARNLAILNNGKVTHQIDPMNEHEIEKYTRLDRVFQFQEFVNQAHPDNSRDEFIRLSRMICDLCTDDHYSIYDYDHIVFIEDTRLGRYETHLYPGIDLSDVWIMIPCYMSNQHQGINCRLIDHLIYGIECLDCLKLFNDNSLYPIE